MAQKHNILVVDGYSRNALAILRSLGANGFNCDIVVERHPIKFYEIFEKIFRSKYAKNVHIITRKQDKELADTFIKILSSKKYDCMLAGGTFYSNFISKHKKEFSKYTKVLSEDNNKIQLVHDKESCMNLANKIGILTPKTFVANNENDLVKIAEETNGNVIVKLSDSFASKGLIKYTQGKKYFIENYKRDFGFDFSPENKPLIQELIVGELIDSTAFSIKGETKAVLTQKRELTAWLEGGGGIVNVTNDIKEVKEGTKKMLQHISWTGHIEMDWIQDFKTKKCYLIEINPKFWGTTQLTISAGFNYPLWFVLYALNMKIDFPAEHKIGLRYRWLDDELVTVFTQPKSLTSFVKEFSDAVKRFLLPNTLTNFYPFDIKPFIKGITDAKIIILRTWIFGKK